MVIPTENLDVIHDSDQNTQHETWSEDSNEITPNDDQLANNISVNMPTNENSSHDNNKRKNEHDNNFDIPLTKTIYTMTISMRMGQMIKMIYCFTNR